MESPLVALVASATFASAVTLSSPQFHIDIDDETGAVVELKDPTTTSNGSMNWVSGPRNAPWQPSSSRWGMGFADLGEDLLHKFFWTAPQTFVDGDKRHISTYVAGLLDLVVSRTLDDDGFKEQYTFTNKGNSSLDLADRGEQALGIYTPFNDHYTNTSDALQNRAHAHVWANGGSTAWVKMDQMSGHGRNLGLVLTNGSLVGYSIEGRDSVTLSNTRGVFVLHPTVPALEPGESYSLEWSMFWHDDREDSSLSAPVTRNSSSALR